jgi:penicillin-binding protein 1A
VRLRRRKDTPRPRRRRRIRKLRLLSLLLVLMAMSLVAFTFGFVRAAAGEIETLDPARQDLDFNTYVYDASGKTILAVLRGDENRVQAKTEDIDPVMRQAIVAIEDRRFHEHRGVDLRGIARALWADVRNQRVVQGGSTITQQFVKNAYVDDQRTIGRKVREAALAWQLEQKWTKDEILTAYLNTIYFGNGAYGIQQAARTYFGKGAHDLDLHEAALLAGIPADPSRYDPVANPREARGRREVVLRTMLDLGDVTHADFVRARAQPLPRREDVRQPGTLGQRGQYFTNYVKERLVAVYGAQKVFGGGLRVKTTIDLGLQQLARDAIKKWLVDPEGPSAALAAVDPRNGDVLAMVGGDNFRESQFNLAVQGARQPGSAFKPIVLATALQQGISPATSFVSKPLTIHLGDRFWPVANYDDAYLGQIDLETATVHSDNSVYAQLTKLLGPAAVVKTAKRLGIESELQPFFSIGLGAQGVNPLELARAYSAFANGGYRVDTETTLGKKRLIDAPRVVEEVRDTDGELLDRNRPRPQPVLSRRAAEWVNYLLQQVVVRGTGERAALPSGIPVAGKTGTTDDYGDAWFVGYTPQLVVAVWVGYPDRLVPMLTEYHGDSVAGGTFPALIWKSFMERALPRYAKDAVSFDSPEYLSGSSQMVVNRDGAVVRDNGLCVGAASVVYFAGFGPKRTADCKPNEVEVPDVRGQTLAAARERLAAQPLNAALAYDVARPLQRVNVVIRQFPAGGRRLSSFDTVTLVLPKAMHGVVPKLEGLTLRKAREKVRKAGLRLRVEQWTDGDSGRVVAQAPRGGVAAAKDMEVKLVVGRG